MSKTRNTFPPEVRERMVRMVGEHCGVCASAWEAMIAGRRNGGGWDGLPAHIERR